MLTDQQLLNPTEATLDSESQEYRLELVRTLAHCFQINARSNPQLASMITSLTIEKFKSQMVLLTVRQLEDRIAAIQVQNPGLLLEAMQAAGHNVRKDKDGNVEIGQPDQGVGRYVTAEEFEA